MTITRLYAPWTPEEQEAITAYQRSGRFHPFTCDQGHHLPLVVGTFELTCPHPGCLYKQSWVHSFMAAKHEANHG